MYNVEGIQGSSRKFVLKTKESIVSSKFSGPPCICAPGHGHDTNKC